jgi:hypothetical protein
MRILGWLALVLAIGVMGAASWIAEYAGMPLPYVFLDATALTKLADMILALDFLAVTVLAFRRVDGVAQAFAWSGLVIGALAACQSGLITWQATTMTHVSRFSVIAPSVAQSLLPLGLGLLPLTVMLLVAQRQTAER